MNYFRSYIRNKTDILKIMFLELFPPPVEVLSSTPQGPVLEPLLLSVLGNYLRDEVNYSRFLRLLMISKSAVPLNLPKTEILVYRSLTLIPCEIGALQLCALQH